MTVVTSRGFSASQAIAARHSMGCMRNNAHESDVTSKHRNEKLDQHNIKQSESHTANERRPVS